MAPLMRLGLAVAALVTTSDAIRKSRKSKTSQPEIDGLYTFGAPASATSPGLQNLRGNDPCFPGLRTSTVSQPLLLGYVDLVVTLARAVGYTHAKQRVMSANIWDREVEYTECNDETSQSTPSGFRAPWLPLHFVNEYVWKYPKEFDHTLFYNISFMAVFLANAKDFPIVGGLVERGLWNIGWRLVARAYAEAGWIAGGAQYSMLAQHPETLDCMLTFQATVSAQDLLADAQFWRADFCSLPVQVHTGFKEHMMRMVKSPEWQRDIRTQLPHCRKVLVGGHSLGGANSELFSACIQKAPRNDEDYREMSWVKGETKAVYQTMEAPTVEWKIDGSEVWSFDGQ